MTSKRKKKRRSDKRKWTNVHPRRRKPGVKFSEMLRTNSDVMKIFLQIKTRTRKQNVNVGPRKRNTYVRNWKNSRFNRKKQRKDRRRKRSRDYEKSMQNERNVCRKILVSL